MSANYQVRLEWGAPALRAQSAHVVVIADADSGPEGDELAGLVPAGSLMLRAEIGNAAVIARRVLAEQERTRARTTVLIVAAGERWPDGSLRPTAADLLVAGRVVDTLAEVGLDAHSPACAAACAAAVTLASATDSLVAAEHNFSTAPVVSRGNIPLG